MSERILSPEFGASARLENLLGDFTEFDPSPGRGDRISGNLVLYGAGNLGRSVLAALRRGGVKPVAFADDTPEKQGTIVDGLRVFSPEAAVAAFTGRLIFAVTILNEALPYLSAQEQLLRRTKHEVISFLELAMNFPDLLLPHLQYDRPDIIKLHADEIRRAFHCLSDEESRHQFIAHLEFRLTANYLVLPSKSRPPYFPHDLIPRFPPDVTFIDCGAYDGDTIHAFLAHQNNKFGSIVAFEPDPRNCEKLAAFVTSLEAHIKNRIEVHCDAVGEFSGKATFQKTGDMSAAVTSDARGDTSLVALDDIVRPTGTHCFIKLDIEGYELHALRGAVSLIESTQATLAVSAYHRPTHLWDIPLYLHGLNLGYKLYLRTEGHDGMEIICYACR